MENAREADRMRFAFRLADSWPPLAWLARYRPGSEVVDVAHGARVETTPEWFCEAVWDAAYEDGGFDRTDLVFGSGGRVRNGGCLRRGGGGKREGKQKQATRRAHERFLFGVPAPRILQWFHAESMASASYARSANATPRAQR